MGVCSTYVEHIKKTIDEAINSQEKVKQDVSQLKYSLNELQTKGLDMIKMQQENMANQIWNINDQIQKI